MKGQEDMAEKVLVLGGSYFVGKKIVEYLAEKEYEVTVLNRGTKPVLAKNVTQLCCDRNDAEGMKSVLAGKDFNYVIDVSWQDVSKINEIICRETDFEEGLKKSFKWFLENKEDIVFKANVDKNLYEIIAELSV